MNTFRDQNRGCRTASQVLLDPPDLAVRPSPISGQGLFTQRAWPAGETIMVIAGELINEAESERRRTQEGNCYIYLLRDDAYIDPPPWSKARYVNHSCRPNAIPETRDDRSLNLKALTDIAAGEEITIDYDFAEIYDVCRQVNRHCLQAECPAQCSRVALASTLL